MMPSMMTDSRLASASAGHVFHAFEHYMQAFSTVTRRGRARFEQRDWHGAAADSAERLVLYRSALDTLVATITQLQGSRADDRQLWASVKAAYSALIARRDDWELAETFFNSLTRRVFTTVGVDQQVEFVHTDFSAPPTLAQAPFLYNYPLTGTVAAALEQILNDAGFDVPYADRTRDVRAAASVIIARLDAQQLSWHETQIELIRSPFYRNKAAYLIGRIVDAAGDIVPFVLALRHPDEGVCIDAVLLHEDDIAVLFSFTRAYFRVECSRPHDLVWFLKTMMPRKRLAELYIAIGFNKHGKTELYRDLLHELATTDEQFVIAPGVRGMVMLVFTLPSYDLVFKIIKDQFDAPKTSTRSDVEGKYDLVFQHDRAGRLIDAQVFEHLQFARNRFSDELFAALQQHAASTLQIDETTVVLRHLYIERRVTPLDMYVRQATVAAARTAVEDYGQALKDLAASNIFPGDMLLKNFGVTRHGRVVFYDYDELCWLTDCVFRTLPTPTSDDEEMASEPWYSVGDHDIFPEELGRFLGLTDGLRTAFLARHADLLATPFWHTMQARIRAGVLPDIFPYPQERRL